jgi:hypothetical protein
MIVTTTSICIQSTINVIYIRAFIFLAFITFLYFSKHLKNSPLFWHRHRAFLTCYFDPFFSFFDLHNRKKVNCEITDGLTGTPLRVAISHTSYLLRHNKKI